jgi:hypothetical protein
MLIQIYITAGKILEILYENKKIELPRLCSSLDYPRDIILMSLGWLVRQGYVILEKDEQTPKLSLRKDDKHGHRKIKCPECRLGRQNLCLAYRESLMSPSIDELKRFCLSGEYDSCPLRIKATV